MSIKKADYAPGALITWVQIDPDDTEVVRSGRVWDRAPSIPGLKNEVWVIPDEPRPHDPYCALVVAVKRRGGHVSAGRFGTYGWSESGRRINDDEWFSETHPRSGTGSLAQYAAERAAAFRERGLG